MRLGGVVPSRHGQPLLTGSISTARSCSLPSGASPHSSPVQFSVSCRSRSREATAPAELLFLPPPPVHGQKLLSDDETARHGHRSLGGTTDWRKEALASAPRRRWPEPEAIVGGPKLDRDSSFGLNLDRIQTWLGLRAAMLF